MSDPVLTGLVLAAGGARGAYQAGALAELLPALALEHATPGVIVGESVGAVNAVVLAGLAHDTPQAQSEALMRHWMAASKTRVLRPLWRQLPMVALRYGGEALGVPGLALRGLLDVTPLRRMLEERVTWEHMHANVAGGVLDAVAVTATALMTGRPVTFVERGSAHHLPPGDEIDYRAATLGVDHVMGSAAIPALFPPVRITEPADAGGWYVDGSTRLHTPLRPALDLGVDRLVVIGTTSLHRREPRDADGREVDIGDAAVTLLHAMVEDSLRRDVRRLAQINAHLTGDGPDVAAVRRLRRAKGRPVYREVPCIPIGPADPYEIGDLAHQVFRERYHGWRGLRDPDMEALYRLLGGDSPLQGEVLSFVLFDEVFHTELIRIGRRDARRWLHAHGGARFQPVPLPMEHGSA